ncbi:MAG: MerR family transcriptional regulator [Paracoccus denitrificans]|uniref:MerR family transcriptional regulator n=1 Tax=Paracoccus denitrificans TaxID=266 RepID=A0A533I987_PARDE|nr:MAG: MerR family transcriptional regulator [Paracoccus denitrificans]
MKKAAEAFRSIGEVSQLVGVAPHVLRYWETQFPLFSPVKRRDGRRYYRPDDVKLAAGLCELLREESVSIREAKKQMQADRGAKLKARGAERLGGDFADTTGGSSDHTGEPATSPRKRKVPSSASLPLFPDLEARPESPADRAEAPVSVDWLGRLGAICTDLHEYPAISADQAVVFLNKLTQARRGLQA